MKLRHLTTSALALILMAACTDATSGTGVAPDDIAGTWTATSLIFTSVADNTVSLDEVTDGTVVTLVLRADGTYTFTFVSDLENENETGTYTVSGTSLTVTAVTPTPLDPETMTISRVGDTMTLTLDDIYDFTPDDTVDEEEAATMVIVLAR
jgi:hypothetical protein